MNFILIAVIVLGAIGLIAAVVLFAASKKFAVYEDPRIAQVGELLPGANCGGCGFPGCSGMAGSLVLLVALRLWERWQIYWGWQLPIPSRWWLS